MNNKKLKVVEAAEHIKKNADKTEVRRYWRNLPNGRIEEYYEFWVNRPRREVEQDR